MIVLDSTTKLLQIILAGSVTTNHLQFTSSYADYVATPAAFTPGALSGLTNNTTAVTLVAAPAASTQRQVKRINVYNSDTAPATVTIRLSDSGNFRTQLSVTLQVGERIEYEDAEGFRVFTVTGAVKVTAVASTVEPGYIDGMKLIWNSATSISVDSGSCYIPSVGANVNFPTQTTKAGLALSANTHYHVYAFLNSGVPDVEIVTTAPSSPYNGTARTKTGDTTRRYVGSILSDASGQVTNFLAAESYVAYRTGTNVSPLRVLSGGVATVETTVSTAAVVPVTCRMAIISVLNTATAGTILTGTSDDSNPGPPSSNSIFGVGASRSATGPHPLDSSQAFTYWFNVAPTGGSAFVDVYGYLYER